MKRGRRAAGRSAVLAVSALAGFACAGPSRVVDVRLEPIPDPETGPPLKIVRVTDRRVFTRTTFNPFQPSLREGDLDAAALTSRVVGRRRTTGGTYLGNVMLPEGRSVEALVGEAMTRAFRTAGYRILRSGDPDYASALAVEIDVEQFWTHMDTRLGAWSWEFRTRLQVYAPVTPFFRGAPLCGTWLEARGGPGPGIWERTLTRGLDELPGELRARIAARSANPLCPPRRSRADTFARASETRV